MGRKSGDLAARLWPDRLQELQDGLSRYCDLPILFVDPWGRPLAACEELALFCRHFTRSVSIFRPCLECGRAQGVEEAAELSAAALRLRPLVHVCPLGVLDAALPVIAAGETVGYVLTAQVNGLDELGVMREAVDPTGREGEEYSMLLSRLPRRPRGAMESAAGVLAVVAWLLGALGAARLRNVHLADRIREQSRWIQEETRTDAVTGVLNRRRFCEVVAAEVARARRYRRNLSLGAADIAGFRRVNDEFGHDVGDAVLRAVAQCMTGTLRQTDVVGRVGGDEFALMLPETSRAEAMIALARVRANLEELNASGELPVEVRIAVGICDEVGQAEDMLAAAMGEARRESQLDSVAG